jgi:hypothetical protein
MQNVPIGVTLAAALIGLLARPAAAQTIEPLPEPPPAVAPEPVPATPAARAEAARVRALQEQLFARDAISLTGNSITRGDVRLKAGSLYTIVGRPDLVDQIRRRRIGKTVAISTGIGLAAVGTLWGVVDAAGTSVQNGWNRAAHLCGTAEVSEECADRSHASMIPWAIAIGGGALALGGAVIPSDPLNSWEKRALIDDYNRRLRAGTALSDTLEAAGRTANVRAAVQPDGRSGMLLASCAF